MKNLSKHLKIRKNLINPLYNFTAIQWNNTESALSCLILILTLLIVLIILVSLSKSSRSMIHKASHIMLRQVFYNNKVGGYKYPSNKSQEIFVYQRRFPNLMDTFPHGSSYPFFYKFPIHLGYGQLPLTNQLQQNLHFSCSEGNRNIGKAYQRRNVYKSIIRHAFKYTQKNRKAVIQKLEKEGFEIWSIKSALKEIEYLVKQENEKGKPKNSKKSLERMLESKTVFTYILKDSLELMIEDWRMGSRNKVLQENLQIYKEVCQDYLNRINSIILNHQA